MITYRIGSMRAARIADSLTRVSRPAVAGAGVGGPGAVGGADALSSHRAAVKASCRAQISAVRHNDPSCGRLWKSLKAALGRPSRGDVPELTKGTPQDDWVSSRPQAVRNPPGSCGAERATLSSGLAQ